jgi:molybdopterin molybdotransferase
MLTREKAQEIILETARELPAERLSLGEAAGRILRETVVADRDQPPFDASAMDGIAVRAGDCARPGTVLGLLGTIFAGDPRPERTVGEGETYRIMTGAPVPPGADAVVMVEHTAAEGPDRVRVDREPSRGDHIRYRGEARRAGDPLVPAGASLREQEIGLLATVGKVSVTVGARPRVSIVSTGDEIVPPQETPAPHQIRNGNGPMLASLASGAGGVPGPVLLCGDDLEEVRSAVRHALEADILVAIGGVSMGEADRVGEAFAGEGVESIFHKVAMKPGKPLWFGSRGDTLVFGLPGNPVSSFVGFHVFVEPAMRRMMGASRVLPREASVRMTGTLRVLRDRETFHPVRLEASREALLAHPVPSTGSGDLAALGDADALAITAAGRPPVENGCILPALLLSRR